MATCLQLQFFIMLMYRAIQLILHCVGHSGMNNGLAVCLLNQSYGMSSTLPQLCCEWAPVVCAAYKN